MHKINDSSLRAFLCSLSPSPVSNERLKCSFLAGAFIEILILKMLFGYSCLKIKSICLLVCLRIMFKPNQSIKIRVSKRNTFFLAHLVWCSDVQWRIWSRKTIFFMLSDKSFRIKQVMCVNLKITHTVSFRCSHTQLCYTNTRIQNSGDYKLFSNGISKGVIRPRDFISYNLRSV